MNAGRHRIRCNAGNAFRPCHALRSIFFENVSIRFSSRSIPSADVDINEPEFEPPPELSYIDTGSLRNTLANLRLQNRKTAASNNDGQDGSKLLHGRGYKQTRTKTGQSRLNDLGLKKEIGQSQAQFKRDHGPNDVVSKDDMAQAGHRTVRERAGKKLPVEAMEAGHFTSKKLEDIAGKKKRSLSEEVLEYEGQYVKPIKDIFLKSGGLPWVHNLSLGDGTPRLSRLGAEVKSFAQWIRPNEAELAAKEAVIKETITIVNALLPDYKTEVFGSSRNGLGLASSDIDIRIYKDEPAPPQNWMEPRHAYLPPTMVSRKQNISALNRLNLYFDHIHDYIMCNVRHARYPLLNMQHKKSGIDVQIVCANSTEKQRQRINKHLAQNPHYFDLYAVLKTLLDVRGLTDVFRGGLGSYNLLIMIIAALNMPRNYFNSSKSALPKSDDSLGMLGEELMKVMLFYGSWLDSYNQSIHLEPFKVLQKINPADLGKESRLADLAGDELRLIDHSQPYLLCLEDPEDPTNDLGRQAYGWKHIQATLNQCYRYLFWSLSSAPDGRDLTRHSLSAAVPTYRHRRQLAEEYGRLVLANPELLNFKPPNPRFVRPVRNSGKRGRFAQV